MIWIRQTDGGGGQNTTLTHPIHMILFAHSHTLGWAKYMHQTTYTHAKQTRARTQNCCCFSCVCVCVSAFFVCCVSVKVNNVSLLAWLGGRRRRSTRVWQLRDKCIHEREREHERQREHTRAHINLDGCVAHTRAHAQCACSVHRDLWRQIRIGTCGPSGVL